MKTSPKPNWSFIRNPLRVLLLVLLHALSALPREVRGGDEGHAFGTPEEAVRALVGAARSENRESLQAIFGQEVDEIVNPDRVQAAHEHAAFLAAFDAAHRISRESEGRCVLEVGPDGWPFPIPMVLREGRWQFDTTAGKEEIHNRRIGRNELSVLQVMRALVESQREYASRDRDGDGVLEYAQKIRSSAGKSDGLYWPFELNGEISPLGPLVAEAQTEGYFGKEASTSGEPKPFHGYFFRILTRQGKHSPGGKYRYVIHDNMIGGFAFIAWPAKHHESGVMTFIVNQQGRVFQKDLGRSTARLASRMSGYNPDPTWSASRE